MLLAGTSLGLACDTSAAGGPDQPFFSADLAGGRRRWSRFYSVRYEGAWRVEDDGAVVKVGATPKRAVRARGPHMQYMAEPVVVPSFEAADVRVECALRYDGPVEAGVVARCGYDESYAVVVRDGEALLCRYRTEDREVLARQDIGSAAGRGARITLETVGRRVSGRVEVDDAGAVDLEVEDARALGPGYVGILVNPLSDARGGEARFASFRSSSSGDVRRARARFAYRFAGGIRRDGDRYRARVTARTVVPRPVSFEVSKRADFGAAWTVGPHPPAGGLGAVHAWLGGLDANTEFHWRPVTHDGRRRVAGPAARFRTPPPPGAGTVFAFASCTSGRMTSYPSFGRAASFDPAFYLHAGDWGYSDFNSYDRRADHFQTRWVRLLRTSAVAELLDKAPLLFWQDDHDYQADNGWAKTCKPFAIKGFDELHANPSDAYFDVRWGDVHVWCLDCRLFATDPDAPDDASKSRLGARQKAWLKRGMSASDAPVRIVASAMAFRDKVNDDPGWQNVYTHERDELLRFFSEVPATVVILSGDSHGQRLIHHFEFGDLWEITASGTDFPAGLHFGQGVNDPEHTVVYEEQTGFAVVELDPVGRERRVTVRLIATSDGSVLFEKRLPVA